MLREDINMIFYFYFEPNGVLFMGKQSTTSESMAQGPGGKGFNPFTAYAFKFWILNKFKVE
jgi:hypothetical protein